MGNSAMTLFVVKDLQKTKDFYLNVLEMTLIEETQNGIKLALGAHHILVFEGEGMAVGYQHGVQANSNLVIEVANLDAKLAQLKRLNIPILHDEPGENKWGRYSAFKDPSGIVHEFFQAH